MSVIANANVKPKRSAEINVGGRELASWLLMLTAGAVVSALGVAAFLVPAKVAGPGVLGVATIMNHLWAAPIGLITLIANIPIQILGYRYLGGMKTILGTIYYISYSPSSLICSRRYSRMD